MRILTVENRKEERFLRRPAKPFDFSRFSNKEIEDLIAKTRKMMKSAQGIGLSANQLGLDFKMFVAELPVKGRVPKFYAIFNPKIEKIFEKKTEFDEGCLSVPKIYGKVRRPERIVLSGFDKNGRKIKVKARGFLARIFQHEVDHLNGKLFVDRAEEIYQIKEDGK